MTTRPEITLTHLDEAGAAYMIVDGGVRIETTVRTADRTGVEMEALTAATVAGLAIVDMVKGVDRGVELREAKVVAKSGGRSGDWVRGDCGDEA